MAASALLSLRQLRCTQGNRLEVPFKFQYTDRMKNNAMSRLRAQEINYMNEDDKSMHIFYTLEEIEQLVENAMAQQEEFEEKAAAEADEEQQRQLALAEAQGKDPMEEEVDAPPKQKV